MRSLLWVLGARLLTLDERYERDERHEKCPVASGQSWGVSFLFSLVILHPDSQTLSAVPCSALLVYVTTSQTRSPVLKS